MFTLSRILDAVQVFHDFVHWSYRCLDQSTLCWRNSCFVCANRILGCGSLGSSVLKPERRAGQWSRMVATASSHWTSMTKVIKVWNVDLPAMLTCQPQAMQGIFQVLLLALAQTILAASWSWERSSGEKRWLRNASHGMGLKSWVLRLDWMMDEEWWRSFNWCWHLHLGSGELSWNCFPLPCCLVFEDHVVGQSFRRPLQLKVPAGQGFDHGGTTLTYFFQS